MKKILFFVSALAGLFFAASCQQENLEPVGGNTVTYTVQVPEALATRALGDDVTNINTLHYEVYRTAERETVTFTDADNLLYHKTAPVNNGTATIALELVNDQNYTVLFWAQVGETNEAYEVSNLTNVTVKSALKANQKDYAAFSGVDFIEADETLAGRTVTLYRPISQINIATTPESLNGNGAFVDQVVLEGSSVTVAGLSNSFNVAKQAAGASMTSTYQFSEQVVPDETLEVNSKAYTYVAMNYVGFADELGTPVKVSYVINTTEGNIDNEIENVPVKPNYRTNIVGNLITSTSDYTITLEDKWNVDPTQEFVVVTDALTLQAAIDNAGVGTTKIKLNADITGDVTVTQKPGVNIIIDGNNVSTKSDTDGITYTGSIKIHSNSNYYTDSRLTLENIAFTPTSGINCIEALENGSQRYSANITVMNCSFNATNDAVNNAVGVQIKASKNAKVLNCTSTGLHSLVQAQSCDEAVEVKNCTVNGKNGVAFKQVKSATVEGTTITATGYGIRFDGNTDNYGITVKNNKVSAYQPLIVRKMTGQDNTIALEGTNTLETAAEYQIVITNGQDDAEYVKPTGTYTLTGAKGFKLFPAVPVAKVGNTEYTSIDEAIANWAHNTTLTLIADVTLPDVITLKSTEYRVLDLGTFTMTAAKGKDAISITAEGRSSASYALDIKADATNPGGITATSKAVVKTTGKSGVKDRPIIRFYNGVYNASNVISHSGSNGTNCPQFQFHGGIYNASLSANRALIQIYGGTFNGRFYISVDSSAYALISGGKFKYLDNLYGSALNSDKFTIGSSKGNFNRGVYVDDEGYIVVGGDVITEFGDKFTAKATNASKAGSYLPYSSAAEYGLYYTNAEMAIAKHGKTNVVLK